MSETIRPRPGDLEAACKRHAPVPSGERVGLNSERCDLCGLSWGSPIHESAGPCTEQEEAS
jgi:hypothetical protein